MNKIKIQKNKGFTIVEAMVAIFILTISVSSMLGVTASSATSARYANNEITANYLLQEAVDYIRNSRDSIAFQQKIQGEIAGTSWNNFLTKYSSCISTYGCDIKMDKFSPDLTTITDIVSCKSSGCDNLTYDANASSSFFYSHDITANSVSSHFNRNIKIDKIGTDNDQIKITVTVSWLNGSLTKSQSLVSYLLNWQK